VSIVFAFGSRPQLVESEARVLARLAQQPLYNLAERIREAGRSDGRVEVEVTAAEMPRLLALLERSPFESLGFERLRRALANELATSERDPA
jgi:hypothetical protein